MQLRKILVVAANPTGTSRLRLDEEVREIQAGLKRAKNRELFDIEQRWAVRARDLRQAMLDVEPNFVHFCGHGSSGGLFVENESGQHQLIEPEALAGLFELCTVHVECVLLNACYSETQAEAIHHHINYVIGMNQAIGDRAAIEFAVGFYDALGAGRSIEDAYSFGRNAIAMQGISEYLTPVLKTKVGGTSTTVTVNWNNEAYVSLHLVESLLDKAGLSRKSASSHWYPQFRIKTSQFNNKAVVKDSAKPVDFLIEDYSRNIQFLVEVKSANTRIDDRARFQLRTYLQYSSMQWGILIDPFKIEIHEWSQARFSLRSSFVIESPEIVQPAATFLRSFLDSIS